MFGISSLGWFAGWLVDALIKLVDCLVDFSLCHTVLVTQFLSHSPCLADLLNEFKMSD